MNKKTILVIFQPHRAYHGSLLEMLVEGLKTTGLQVEYIDITNKPTYEYHKFTDKIKNIFSRVILKNKQYILKLEVDFINKYYYKKIKEFKKKQHNKFDYVLVIKPEEFTDNVIKEISSLGDITVGYIWDGLRLFLKENLLNNKKYLKNLYSFDTNNIKEHPELNLQFCSNFAVYNQQIIPYHERKKDLFFVGDLAGTLENQRRDIKLERLLQAVDGNFDVNIYLGAANSKITPLKSDKIKYINQFISLIETKERTRNAKVVIDICKNHHIGLSFRFFECLATETKIITNNKDVVNYDFYNPNNIWVVDFDQDILDQSTFNNFIHTPYEKIEASVLHKFSIVNWVKYLFSVDGYIPISKQ